MFTLQHYLKLSQAIQLGDWITDAVGPFDNMHDARAWWSANDAALEARGVKTVTCRVMVKP